MSEFNCLSDGLSELSSCSYKPCLRDIYSKAGPDPDKRREEIRQLLINNFLRSPFGIKEKVWTGRTAS